METSFILLSCFVLISITAARGTTVLDTDGKPVLRGVPYYVLAPQVRGLGNLGLASPSGSCPLNVYLKPFPYGPAAMFFPERSQGNSSVLVGEDLSVIFAAPTKCSDSTQWKLDMKTGLVMTGGALLPSSEKISYSRFRIARYEFPGRNFYQFLCCPGGNIDCSTLGVTTEQLLRRTTQVLAFTFMKVPEGSV